MIARSNSLSLRRMVALILAVLVAVVLVVVPVHAAALPSQALQSREFEGLLVARAVANAAPATTAATTATATAAAAPSPSHSPKAITAHMPAAAQTAAVQRPGAGPFGGNDRMALIIGAAAGGAGAIVAVVIVIVAYRRSKSRKAAMLPPPPRTDIPLPPSLSAASAISIEYVNYDSQGLLPPSYPGSIRETAGLNRDGRLSKKGSVSSSRSLSQRDSVGNIFSRTDGFSQV